MKRMHKSHAKFMHAHTQQLPTVIIIKSTKYAWYLIGIESKLTELLLLPHLYVLVLVLAVRTVLCGQCTCTKPLTVVNVL